MVLVTGGDGLLGSNLVRELLAQGFKVRVLVQPGSKSPTLKGLPIEMIPGDLLAADDTLKKAAAGCVAIFHCAAITNLWAPEELVFKVNVEGTRKILDLCVAEQVRKFVFVGSASAYQFGTLENPGDERGSFPAEYRGIPYMESKRQAIDLVREYVANKGLDALIVAPTFMLGRYDYAPSSGELIRQFIVRKMSFASPGGRNFVFVGDVAKAMVSALERGKKGESYILGGENLSLWDFFTMTAKIAGVAPPKFHLPKPVVIMAGAAGSLLEKISGKPAQLNLRMARLGCMGTYYNAEKARRELGMPSTKVAKAIEESIQSLKEYGHI